MLRPFSKITFHKSESHKDIVFDFIQDVEIDDNHENLTQTASIVIARKLKFEGKPIAVGLNSLFKIGDKVTIELGYYPRLRKLYTGYITNISVGTPITIKLSDEMYILSKKKIIYPVKRNEILFNKKGKKLKNPKVIPSVLKLKDFLQNVILDGTDFKLKCLLDTNIFIKQLSGDAVYCLDELKRQFKGLYFYFQNGVLVAGFLNDASYTKIHKFHFENSIIDANSLEYQRKDDVRLGVTCESINPKTNERIIVFVGDHDGQQKKIFSTQFLNKTELEKFAKAGLEDLKYEGYKNSFTTFGETYVQAGDAVQLTSDKYPEKNGTYLVKSVKRKFGLAGYRQIIELGIKIS